MEKKEIGGDKNDYDNWGKPNRDCSGISKFNKFLHILTLDNVVLDLSSGSIKHKKAKQDKRRLSVNSADSF